ncbi:MAG: T9SS type A sorting domain-containing protein, partial [Pseudomonadales bacterium]|nr:T9SS type A sorting domain-containing protein [Pseudomonadales bacterium]
TGSMSDEIKYLKTEFGDITTQSKAKNEHLNLKLGSLFYRCLNNIYVTRKSSFSADINQTIEFIKEQRADEGGTEALEVALTESVNDFNWSDQARARLLFLILDEPPGNIDSIVEELHSAIALAAEKGIRIIPLVASGADKSTEYLMRAMALATNGTYAFLTDHSGVGNKHMEPTTNEYDVEYMNLLILRLIQQFSKVPSCHINGTSDLEGISDTTFVEIIEHVILDSSDITNIVNPDTVQLKPTESLNLTSRRDKKAAAEKPLTLTITKSFKFYPNPTSGPLTIEIEGEIKELFLSDMNGKLLERFQINNQTKTEIDISRYPDGLYLISYLNNKKCVSGKVLIARN